MLTLVYKQEKLFLVVGYMQLVRGELNSSQVPLIYFPFIFHESSQGKFPAQALSDSPEGRIKIDVTFHLKLDLGYKKQII